MDKQELWTDSYNVARRVLELGGLWPTEAGAEAMADPENISDFRDLAHAAIDQLDGRELLGAALLLQNLAGPLGDDCGDLSLWLGALGDWE